MCDEPTPCPRTPPCDPPDTSDTDLGLDSDDSSCSGSPDSCGDRDRSRTRSPKRRRLNEELKTLIIVDWDDTLLPSTWLQAQGLRIDKGDVSDEQRAELGCAAQQAALTLQGAKRLGMVVVVTNAEWGWVELSCKKFMPMLWPVLEGVRIRSARSLYEPIVGLSPLLWKRNAFHDELRVFCRQGYDGDCTKGRGLCANVLSLGDSAHERDALMTATQDLIDCWGKSVKFIERPDMNAFAQQHRLLNTALRPIVKHKGSLDLCLRPGECNLIGLATTGEGDCQPVLST